MKIMHCPKGGKMPLGYCEESCLNYCKECRIINSVSLKKKRGKSSAFNGRETESTGSIIRGAGTSSSPSQVGNFI